MQKIYISSAFRGNDEDNSVIQSVNAKLRVLCVTAKAYLVGSECTVLQTVSRKRVR